MLDIRHRRNTIPQKRENVSLRIESTHCVKAAAQGNRTDQSTRSHRAVLTETGGWGDPGGSVLFQGLSLALGRAWDTGVCCSGVPPVRQRLSPIPYHQKERRVHIHLTSMPGLLSAVRWVGVGDGALYCFPCSRVRAINIVLSGSSC